MHHIARRFVPVAFVKTLEDNGRAQSNMTKQSARSVPKIEQHELQMVTKCTKWAKSSNTNIE